MLFKQVLGNAFSPKVPISIKRMALNKAYNSALGSLHICSAASVRAKSSVRG